MDNTLENTAKQEVVTYREQVATIPAEPGTSLSITEFMKAHGLSKAHPRVKKSSGEVPYITFVTADDKSFMNVYFSRGVSDDGLITVGETVTPALLAKFGATYSTGGASGVDQWKISRRGGQLIELNLDEIDALSLI